MCYCAAPGNKSWLHRSPQLKLPPGETTCGLGPMSFLLQKPRSDLRSPRGSCTGVIQESAQHAGAKLQSSPLVLHVALARSGHRRPVGVPRPAWHLLSLCLPAVKRAKTWKAVLKGKYGFYGVLPFPGGCRQAGHGEEARSLATALPIIASACHNTLIE